MRRFLALLAIWPIAATTPACAGIRFHGQAVSNACTGQPAGVVGNGLCNVAVSKAANGARGATTNVSVYSLPAGWTYSTGTLNSDIAGAGTNVNLIDNALKGGFYYVGSGTHTLIDFSITSDSAVTGGGNPLTTGVTSGGSLTGNPNFDGEHGTIDGTGMKASQTTMIQPHGTGTFKLGFTNILNAARDPITTDGLGGSLTIANDYFNAYAQNTDASDHNEWIHFQGGATLSVTATYFNMKDGIFPTGGNSGAFQIQTGNGNDPTAYSGGPITATFTGNIIDYGSVINQATWSLKAVFNDITLNVGSNVWSVAATAGTTGIVTQADIKVGTIVGTFTSGETILRTGGGSAPLLGTLTGGNNLHLATWGTGTHFGTGDAVTGQTSGATAVVTSASYHNVTVNNLGGNVDFSNNPVSP